MRLTLRLLVVGFSAVVCLGGCSNGSAEPGADADRLDEAVAPTGAPVDLQPITDADGERVSFGDDLTGVVPDGSTAEELAAPAEGAERLLYRMPDATADGIPAVQVTWLPRTSGSLMESRVHQTDMRSNELVTDYERSAAQWPGADEAVVATWTEEVPTDAAPVVVDCLGLWLDTPGGTSAFAMACAPGGALEGSTSLDALRSLTIG